MIIVGMISLVVLGFLYLQQRADSRTDDRS